MTKYEQETIILFNEEEKETSIYTHNKKLQHKLSEYSESYPELCKIKTEDGQGGVTYIVKKDRLSIRLKTPISEERREKMRQLVKEHGWGSQRNSAASCKEKA